MTSLGPEIITTAGGFPITNTLVATILTDVVLLSIVYVIHQNFKKIPGKLQSVFEMGIDYMYSLTDQIAGHHAPTIFPWFASFFLVIFASNLLGLLPGFGSIGFFHGSDFTPLLRSGMSDFNTTFGLAVVSLVATHVISIRAIGIKQYLSRFFSINPILLFVGFLELISEFTKMFSLAFRLFGNIYAGEVVIGTVSGLAKYTAFLAPIPFMLLEIIVALVQALVFSMLTMVFMAILATPHIEHDEATNE